MAKQLYALVIELDGQIPPSKWYNRLNRLTGKARSVRGDGDYTKSAGERRAKDKKGRDSHAIVEQEGVIMFESRAARDFLYTLFVTEIAPEMERTTDTFGRPGRLPKATCYTVTAEEGEISPEMERMAKRVEGTMSVLGRPPAAELHTVCCDECRASYVTLSSRITHCEQCASVYIRYVKGLEEHVRVQEWQTADITDLWLATRIGGELEPNYRYDFDSKPTSGLFSREANMTGEAKFKGGIGEGVWLNILPFARSLNVMADKMQALRLIDAVFAVEAFFGGFDGTGQTTVENARAYAIAKMWVAAGRKDVEVNNPPDYQVSLPDLFTAALLIDHDELAEIYLTYFNQPSED